MKYLSDKGLAYVLEFIGFRITALERQVKKLSENATSTSEEETEEKQ